MKAISPARIGAVEALSGLVDPANATSNRGTPLLDTAVDATVNKTTAASSAITASKSCRARRRITKATPAAIGKPNVPIPPMTFRAKITAEGSDCTPLVTSSSRPAVVLVANQPTPIIALVMAMARTKRARSRGRRTRRVNGSSSISTPLVARGWPSGVTVTGR